MFKAECWLLWYCVRAHEQMCKQFKSSSDLFYFSSELIFLQQLTQLDKSDMTSVVLKLQKQDAHLE